MTGLFVCLAGGVGALLRLEVGHRLRSSGRAQWGTRTVNLTGAVALAVLVGRGFSANTVEVLGTGLLGGFTTFSTWMVEATGQAPSRVALEVLGQFTAGLVLVALTLWATS